MYEEYACFAAIPLIFYSFKYEPKSNYNFELTNEDFSYIGYDMKPTLPLNKVKVIIKDLEVVFDINTGKLYE